MARLKIHTPDSAPTASQPLVQQALQNNGYLPNLIGVLANAPAALEAYFAVGALNANAALSLPEREAVQLTAARLNGCDFCVAGHTALALRKAQLDGPTVLALQRGRPTGQARLDAVQAFTTELIGSRGAVSDEALQAFLSAGFTQAQSLEVVLGVSLATLCNFANTLAQSPVNPQLEPYRPGVFGG